jgi:hypothetical protein
MGDSPAVVRPVTPKGKKTLVKVSKAILEAFAGIQ